MIEILNIDCIEYMKGLPDNAFDIAVVDPPYGIEDKISIGGGSHTKSKTKFHNLYKEKNKTWDKRPSPAYWKELLRVSKNQIVFGANYFASELPVSRGWAYWHKQGEKMSSVNDELIWTSFDISIKMFSRCHGKDKGFMNKEGTNIHPTQKPLALYKWVYENYLTAGWKILDTHLGSGTSAIVAEKMGFDFVGCELDVEYYEAAKKRFYKETDLPLFKNVI